MTEAPAHDPKQKAVVKSLSRLDARLLPPPDTAAHVRLVLLCVGRVLGVAR
jgi:hypothetical protein